MLFSTYVILPWPFDIFQALADKPAKVYISQSAGVKYNPQLQLLEEIRLNIWRGLF